MQALLLLLLLLLAYQALPASTATILLRTCILHGGTPPLHVCFCIRMAVSIAFAAMQLHHCLI